MIWCGSCRERPRQRRPSRAVPRRSLKGADDAAQCRMRLHPFDEHRHFQLREPLRPRSYHRSEFPSVGRMTIRQIRAVP